MQAQNSRFEHYGLLIATSVMLVSLMLLPIIARAECSHGHWNQAQRTEFFERRQAAVHDKLALSAAQESAWNDLVVKLKPGAHAAKPEWSELSSMPTPERLDRLQAIMKDRYQTMESHASAIKTFYAGLTPEQQKVFDKEFFPGRGDHHRH